MKKIKYIILGLSLVFAIQSFGQSYFQATYNMAAPMGDTKDYIDKFSPRGFGLEAGGWLNNDISLGFNFQWQGFYEAVPEQTYHFENDNIDADITTKVWKYSNQYPLMGVAKYYFGTGSDFEPYVGAGIGTIIHNRRTEFGIYAVNEKQWHFALYPEIGGIYWFNPETGLIMNLKYMWASKSGDLPSQSFLNITFGFIWHSY